MSETPKQAARRLAKPWIAQGYMPEALHVYKYPDGRPWYWRIRAKRADTGEKIIRPMRLNGHGYELREPTFENGKPLYNLDLIAKNPDADVDVVEGEKAADALVKLGAVATTSGGADSAGSADWTPLRGRTVRLWSDNDDAGKAYVSRVAVKLLELDCKVSVIDIDQLGLPPKGDAADWVQARQSVTLADLEALPRMTSFPATANAMLADPERPRLSVVTILGLVNAKLPTPVPLLAPWLITQGLTLVHAWRGTGKTHFSLGVAYAVATAGTFLRWHAPRPHPVLFIDGEMPAVALQQRMRAILEADERDLDIDENMLRFLTPDLLNGAPPDLADAADQEELQVVIDNCSPSLIVVDNISTLVRSGGAENDAEAWLPVQGWALGLRRQGRAALLIHHTGKSGAQRGTSKREDVLDTVICLKRPIPYSPADGARFIVEFEKARYLHGIDTASFEAQLSTGKAGKQIWTTRDIEDATLERVVDLRRGGLRPGEIAKELGVNKSTVSRALKKARELGLVLIDGGKEG
jgi:hypothetical protein